MAVIQKTLFPKNLDRYAVLVTDTEPNSRYFKVTELPDTFTGGKNAFLIAGSEELLADTKIQIELKDAVGNIIYHEPGEGYFSSSFKDNNDKPIIIEYFEGVSKVVSVYVYPDTAYGTCTLTILGELSEYQDANGVTLPVPLDWENKYNVKWQKTINVNPSLANTTKIRFYQRPVATITEILSPIYRIESGSKVNSGVSQSFANIKLSRLETFAGDVKRVKVFRTSDGDISDFDLIQDILVESKELLTSYDLVGSVVGNTGILTSETLQNYWNTGSLNAFLTSSRVESGVRLTGSGYFTYTSSLDIKSANTYELNLDAFYSSSTTSNLGIYLASGSMSSSIGTLSGISPTKNLLDTVIPFKIPIDFPSASLYFSQSQGEWHLGNISLKLSQDTAFSPDEIGFVTTMPSVIGNETFNFKFEFYDVNNNYVPVAVTQSATFTGGANINNTLLLVSASTSQSLAALAAVSSSISGTMTVYSSSASSSVNTLSSSVSGSINIVSSSVSSSLSSSFGFTSASVYTLSASVSNSLTLTSGSITLVSSSLVFTSQSLSSSLTTLSASVSSSFSFNASQSAYQVYSASQYLDKFIFTDENGKLNQPPTASDPGLYLGSEYLGYFSGSGTTGWKTYMDNQGDFYLTSSVPGGGLLAWNAATATLQINGSINIQGGNAATNTALSSSLTAVSGAINSATSSLSTSVASSQNSLSTSVAATTFTTNTGLIAKPPTVLVGSTSGLYLGNSFLGYYDGAGWKTFMANNGNFYLSGSGGDSLTWAGGVLSINGAINITGGNAATTTNVTNAAANAVTSGSTAATNAVTSGSLFAANAATSASLSASAVDDKVFTNALGRITKAPTPGSTAGLYLGSTNLGYYNGGTWRTYMDNTGLFYLTGSNNGNALLWDGSTLSIKGTIKVSDGTEVTPTVITNANSALQTGQTGKSLGLTGGSIGGVTIASTKIYVGTGTWGNSNTGFYVDSTGQFSLKDKLTWNGTTLSVIGDITVGSTLLTEGAILNTNTTAANVGLGSVQNLDAQNQAQTGLIAGTTITGGGITLSGGGNIKGGQTAYNTGTGFFLGYSGTDYKFSIGNASTKGITWDGNTLSIGGDVTIGVNLASALSTTTALTTGLNGKIATGGAASDVNSGVTKISGGQITANTITANEISSLNFTGKTATFDQGTIGGWTINSSNINKAGSTHTITLDSTNNVFKITQNANSVLRVAITGSTTIPSIAIASQDFLDFTYSYGNRYNVTADWSLGQSYANQTSNVYLTSTGGRSDGPSSTGYNNPTYAGIIGLIYPTEEIWIDDSEIDWTQFFLSQTRTLLGNGFVDQRYKLYLRVRKFANHNDAYTESNVIETFERLIADNFYYEESPTTTYNTDSRNVNGTSIQVNSNGNNYFRVDLYQQQQGNVFANTYGNVSAAGFDFNGTIKVRFGQINNGYSLFGPGGLQVYQGLKNYMNVSTAGSSFFQVKGKSVFESGLFVSGTFDANNKQFKITHPLNENKWLYHTSTEAPRADLIYRGTLQLQSGAGSASIDSVSNMTIGTFDILTKNQQLFLQNNESFDRVKGYVESGNVYVLSENQNSTASIDWSVMAERKDGDLLSGKTYINGIYQTERYKTGQHPIIYSGSI
jgi:hypothetical protein